MPVPIWMLWCPASGWSSRKPLPRALVGADEGLAGFVFVEQGGGGPEYGVPEAGLRFAGQTVTQELRPIVSERSRDAGGIFITKRHQTRQMSEKQGNRELLPLVQQLILSNTMRPVLLFGIEATDGSDDP